MKRIIGNILRSVYLWDIFRMNEGEKDGGTHKKSFKRVERRN